MTIELAPRIANGKAPTPDAAPDAPAPPPPPMPRSLRILGADWAVVAETSPLANKQIGLCDQRAQRLTVAADMAAGQRQETLFHEMLHAVVFAVHADDIEERDHANISGVLFATLRDNPDFVAWLMHEGG